ncbi:AAA domain-containing protein [Intestinibacillus massiliensis]|nr:AAA domain-containing protein [Intestinibacillus massiliensis]
MYRKLLQYWYQLEFFSPAWPVDMKTDIDLSKGGVPWGRTPPDPQYKTYYDIYLGRLSCQELIETLIGKLQLDTPDEIEKDTSFTCVCAAKLDEDGAYVPGSFAVSTFVWALCRMLAEGDFRVALPVSEWKTFQELADTELMERGTIDSISSLASVLERIMKKLGLDNGMLHRPCYWARRKRYKRRPGEPEPSIDPSTELFGSFYLKDIARVMEADAPHVARFAQAMQNGGEAARVHIDVDMPRMKSWLTAERFPMGKWPSVHSPSLMQQLAINLALGNQDVFSVNGPPGTGKTTLLKEIIAANIVERAALLSTYEKPENAFQKTDFSDPPDEFSKYFYAPDPALSRFGILVASNNNGAVENISQELPKPVGDGLTGLFGLQEGKELYFSDVASGLLGEPAWGLISARLGKQGNLKGFKEAAFWNKGCNLHTHFSGAKPSWEQARRDFSAAYGAVADYRNKIQEAQARRAQYEPVERAYLQAKAAVQAQQSSLEQRQESYRRADQDCLHTERLLEAQTDSIGVLKKSLSWLKRLLPALFPKDPVLARLKQAREEVQKLSMALSDYKVALAQETAALEQETHKLHTLEAEAVRAELDWTEKRQALEEDRALFGENYADEAFWEGIAGNVASQKACPWTNREYDALREALFYQALQLHKAFVLNCEPVEKNLYRLNSLWDGKFTLRDKVASYAALLNTLFLIVPVISTTFASVQAFLEGVSPRELGLLIIDEAGQAVPQSALGAVLRTQRAVVVGDPLQVEPVVTIPRELAKRFADEYEIPGAYRVPSLSVQNLADAINPYGGERICNGEALWLGCPLVMHRRCIDPMFSISNEIAYNNRMFCKSRAPETTDGLLFQHSAWLDIRGAENGGKDHTVQAQNDKVCEIIVNAVARTGRLPDVFVISPFKTVIRSLKAQLASCLEPLLPEGQAKDVRTWLDTSCGTVHTFQGKEADEVILVLGCDGGQGKLAADWVGQKPNILNVAVTRAKYRLAVIGDRSLWHNVRFADTLCDRLEADVL